MIIETFICVIVSMPLEVNNQASTIDGTFQNSIHMPGELIGDYDEVSYPEGTMTRPGVWGGTGNQPIACSIEPIIGGPFSENMHGMIDAEFDFESNLMTIAALDFHAIDESNIQFPLSAIFEYETFRSITPDSLFVGGFPIEIPFGEGLMTQLDLSLQFETSVQLEAVGSSEWIFQTELAVLFTIDLEMLGTSTGPLPVPGVLFLNGTVTEENGSINVTGSSSWKMQEAYPDPPIYFDAVPLELPTILPPGDFAGVYLSAAADQLVSTFIANLYFEAIGEIDSNPSDINGDGVVNVSDLLEIISAWGACGSCPADVNNDGLVNVTDILEVIGNWSGS